MERQAKLSTSRIREFQLFLFQWWKGNKRDFPWRETRDPYHIMVAEFMLQQTQAERVVPKYLVFLDAFPTMADLAEAGTREVLRVWSGLGYNRRALWLQEACKKILLMGGFPRSPQELRMLKGIGPYTSRSILIFAFNMDLAAVDTNIRRILIHEGFATKTSTHKELFQIAERLVPTGRSRDWHNALMDYGALEVTSRSTGIKSKNSQSRFRGSVREARGVLLKCAVENGFIEPGQMVKEKGLSEEAVDKAIESLSREGLLFEERGKLFLKE